MLRIDSNLIWIIVNLLIFYFLIRKFLFKPVLNIIEKRKQMVAEQFEKADTVNAEALELKTQYEASLQGAKEEAVQIVADARERAGVQYKQIVSDAENDPKLCLRKQIRIWKKNVTEHCRVYRKRSVRWLWLQRSRLSERIAVKSRMNSFTMSF